MTITLAEIGDKASTPFDMVLWGVMLGTIIVSVGVWRFWTLCFAISLGVFFACFYSHMIVEDHLSDNRYAIIYRQELGEFHGVKLLVALNCTIIVFIAATVVLHRWVQRLYRNQTTSCLTCGYNLRGSTKQEECPECGTQFDSTHTRFSQTCNGLVDSNRIS